MVYSEGAKQIDVQEMKDAIEETMANPTIERLMFIETRDKEGVPGKVFPFYLVAWSLEKGKTNVEADHYLFKADILQSIGGAFQMVEVIINSRDFGVNKRIWDKPPTKGLRDETPWLETVVKQ